MRSISLLVCAAFAAGCVNQVETATSTHKLCTVADQESGLCDGPLGGWDPASRYPTTATAAGQPVDRVGCGAISTAVGDHWTVCNVSVGGTVLLSCTFYYTVAVECDCCATLTSYSCGVP